MFAQMLFAHLRAKCLHISRLHKPSLATKETQIQWASTKHHMKGVSLLNSSLIGRKNQAKFENDYISRNGHGFKITQPN